MQQKKKKKHNLLSNGKNHANIHQASIMFTNVFLKDCMLLSFKFYWENGVVRGKCFARIIFSQGTVTQFQEEIITFPRRKFFTDQVFIMSVVISPCFYVSCDSRIIYAYFVMRIKHFLGNFGILYKTLLLKVAGNDCFPNI